MSSLRETMAGALRARREERGLSLEAVARRCELTKPGVHGLEVGRTGQILDHMEAVARALGARWSVTLLPETDDDARGDLLRAALAVPVEHLAELVQLVRSWSRLTDDDRAVIALLVTRRARIEDIPRPVAVRAS